MRTQSALRRCVRTVRAAVPEPGFDFAQREIAGHRRGVAAQPRQRFAHRLGHALVEVARHLAELHHPALHVPRASTTSWASRRSSSACIRRRPRRRRAAEGLGPGAVRSPAGGEAGHHRAASASRSRRSAHRRAQACTAPAHGGDRWSRPPTIRIRESARQAPHVRPRWMTRVRRRMVRRSGPPAMQRALRPDRDRPNPAP